MPDATDAAAKAAVKEANATFYRAFSDGDAAAMHDLWAERAPVACLHPMAQAVMGREAVLESWDRFLGQGPRFELRCEQPVVHLLGTTAFVTCYEGAGGEPAHLAATNVFVLEDGRWRMVHHHAGPLSSPIPRAPDKALVN